jgi:aminopeptidase N
MMRSPSSMCLAFTLSIASVVSLGAQQQHYQRQPGLIVEHYVFGVTLTDANDDIAGETTVTTRFTRAGMTSFFLDLSSVANGKGMTVTAVNADSTNGAALRYAHTNGRLTITLAPASRAGEERRFTIRYHGVPGDGLRIGMNKYRERAFFSWNWPDHAHDWLPTIDHPSSKATSEFVVTAPEQYSVVANGLLQREISLGDGRKLTHWKESVPIAVWLNALGVEQFGVHHGGFVKGVELQTWVAHQEAETAPSGFEPSARQALEFFSENIGPYAYEKLANVTAPFGGGAMEHASEIYYGDGGTRNGEPPPQAGAAGAGGGRGGAGGGGAGRGGGGRGGGRGGGPRGASSHEIAHQWFGDSVTEDEWDDVWLSEGFATYFANLYTEHFSGRDAFVNALTRGRIAAFRAERQFKKAVVHANDKATGPDLTQVQYQKGGWVLHVLRGQVGTENFWKGIQLYYKTYRDAHATTDDLRHAMEVVSGQDLAWFFTQWLTRVDAPVVDGSWTYDAAAKKIVVQLSQTQAGAAYRMPMEIGVPSDSAGAPMRIEKIEMTQKQQRFEIAADRAPADVALDPNVWMLMEATFVKR